MALIDAIHVTTIETHVASDSQTALKSQPSFIADDASALITASVLPFHLRLSIWN